MADLPRAGLKVVLSEHTQRIVRRTFASGLASLGVALPVIERLLNYVSGGFGGIVGVYRRYDFMPECGTPSSGGRFTFEKSREAS